MLQNPQFKAYGIGDIAWACGFADPSHFARRFRQCYGINPIRYRAPVELNHNMRPMEWNAGRRRTLPCGLEDQKPSGYRPGSVSQGSSINQAMPR
jgi:hypothetical protein